MQSQKRQYWEKILLIVLMTLNIYLVVYSIVAILIGSLVVHDYELIDPTRLSSNESTQTLEQMFEKTKLSIGKIGSSILVIGLFSLGVAFIGLFGVIYKSRIAFITQSILLFLMLVGCIVSLAIFGQRVKDSRYIFKHKVKVIMYVIFLFYLVANFIIFIISIITAMILKSRNTVRNQGHGHLTYQFPVP